MRQPFTHNGTGILRNILFFLAVFGMLWTGSGGAAAARPKAAPERNLPGNASQAQNSASAFPTDQIILKYLPGSRASQAPQQPEQMARLQALSDMPLRFVRTLSGGAAVLRLPARIPLEQVQALAAQFMTLPEVEYAEPDQLLQPTLEPNDPQYSNQWHYFAPVSGNYGINLPAAWDITTGSASIVVAVIDTGITNHADLSGRTVPGYDFIGDILVANDGNGRDSDPSDPGDWITAAENGSGYFKGCGASNSSWHGTHTAGTIGAASNNGIGVTGINWNSKILPARVLGKCGGYDSDIIDAMLWAAGLSVSGVPANANPAKVENISLGGSGACSTSMQTAINSVMAAGTTIVVSAGNSNADASGFTPANCNGVITVAATNRSGNKAWYSNYGTSVEISAPGGDTTITTNGVLSTLNTGTTGPVADKYAYYQGTSMSAPHVTGVVSLLYSLNPSLTPAQVLQILQSNVTAFPSGSTCNTSKCGPGILNAGAAVGSMVYQLSVDKTGSGGGTVTSNPSGVACGSACSYYFLRNSSILLSAESDANSQFSGWSGGGCLGNSSTCTVSLDAVKTVTATFDTTPTDVLPTVSGFIGVAGVTINYTGGVTVTDAVGNYSFTVPIGGSVTITPAKACYTFSPPSRQLLNIQVDQPDQDFTATPGPCNWMYLPLAFR